MAPKRRISSDDSDKNAKVKKHAEDEEIAKSLQERLDPLPACIRPIMEPLFLMILVCKAKLAEADDAARGFEWKASPTSQEVVMTQVGTVTDKEAGPRACDEELDGEDARDEERREPVV